MLVIKKTSHPYTLRELLECDYPELLEATESMCVVLTELQNAIVELLPLSKRLLPFDIKQLAHVEKQANLMTYIYYHSLFAFADEVYTILNKQCTALAEALNSNDKTAEDAAADELEQTLQSLGRIPFDTLLNHGAVGLLRLEHFKDYLRGRLILCVIPKFDPTGKIRGGWTFDDITGSIVRNGLDNEGLLKDVINTPLPNASTIGKVIDDETLVRMY